MKPGLFAAPAPVRMQYRNLQKSPEENDAILLKMMAKTSSSTSAVADKALMKAAADSTVTLHFQGHILSTAAEINKLASKAGAGGQFLDLVPFKNLDFSGPRDVINDLKEGKAFLAPEEIIVQDLTLSTPAGGIAIETPAIKAAGNERFNQATGDLALFVPIGKLLASRGLVANVGTLFDRPHTGGVAEFLTDYGHYMVNPDALKATYQELPGGKLVAVTLDTPIHRHFDVNAEDNVLDLQETPTIDAAGGHIHFAKADFKKVLDDLLATSTERAAIFNAKDLVFRVRAQGTTDLAGNAQPGRFIPADANPSKSFELMLSGTIKARITSLGSA
jgi:hypothetical protein